MAVAKCDTPFEGARPPPLQAVDCPPGLPPCTYSGDVAASGEERKVRAGANVWLGLGLAPHMKRHNIFIILMNNNVVMQLFYQVVSRYFLILVRVCLLNGSQIATWVQSVWAIQIPHSNHSSAINSLAGAWGKPVYCSVRLTHIWKMGINTLA